MTHGLQMIAKLLLIRSRSDPGIVLARSELSNPDLIFTVTDHIGSLAYAEMELIMAKLLFNFDLELVDGDGWADQKSYTIWEKNPLNVKLTKAAK